MIIVKNILGGGIIIIIVSKIICHKFKIPVISLVNVVSAPAKLDKKQSSQKAKQIKARLSVS
ncbi:MAG: hypothetical protein LBE09_04030 [Christensenellaceae bacterium]|nr:hypothetical protein [Christensenellaceae bacterium]